MKKLLKTKFIRLTFLISLFLCLSLNIEAASTNNINSSQNAVHATPIHPPFINTFPVNGKMPINQNINSQQQSANQNNSQSSPNNANPFGSNTTNNNTANNATPIDMQQVEAMGKTQSSATSNNQPSVTTQDMGSFAPGSGVGSRLWNLQDVDIKSVIDEISLETGKNFIIDPRVEGKISIVSSKPMSPNEIYQVFLSSLQVLGYAAVPSGSVVKILPLMDAKEQTPMVGSASSPGKGAEIVVRVLPLKNVPAEQLAAILRPLIPDWGTLSAYAPSNVIIVASSADNVKHIADIINRVDTVNANGIDVVTLHYASATDIVNTVQQLQSTAKDQGTTPQISIAAEDSSNTILLSGNANARLKMRVLISQLDTQNASGTDKNTNVIYLHYLRAQDLVPVLAGIAQSYYRGPVGTVIGTRTQTGADYASMNNNDGDNDASDDSGNASSATQSSQTSASTTSSSNTQSKTSQTNAQGDNEKPKIEIIAEPNTNSIIINAPPTLMRTLRSVVSQLDIKPDQILVEALIAEVDQNTTTQLGIQWGAITSPGQTGISSDDLIQGFRNGIGIINGDGIHNLQGIVKALAQDRNSDILSTPAVLVLDNHQAKILVGQEVSIQQSSFPNNASGTTGATPFTTFGREKVALHLYVTPQINEGNMIQLALDQGNDTLQNPDDTTTTPVINISSIKTSVLIKNGDIIVLGGLMQHQITGGNDRVPILGDIPLFGNLFKVHNHSRTKKDLMVFLRPIIVKNNPTAIQVTNNKYVDMRNTQLDWLRTQWYHSDDNDAALPPLVNPKIPAPFQGQDNHQ